jgi:hypothetical protein
VTSIGQQSLRNCTFTTLNIPDSVTTTEYLAFGGNTSLTTVTIGNSLGNIAGFAFSGCTSLSSLSCTATTAPTLGTTPFHTCTSLTEIHVPVSALADYKAKGNGTTYGGLTIINDL